MAEKKKVDNFTVMNALYPDGADPSWDSRINLQSREFWDTNKVLLSSSSFQPLRNQILEELINRIALTKIRHMNFLNPLRMLKKGEMLFGDTIQEIATDVLDNEKFKGGQTDQFEIKKPVVKAAYHRVNREDLYRVTIEDPRMRRAFLDDYGLQELINEIISMMGGSNEVDEYVYCKQLFTAYYNGTEQPLLSTQIIKVPDLENDPSKANLDKFITQMKLTMRKMMFPNRLYNSAGLMSQTKPDEMMCFLKIDYTVFNEVYNLSSAFRPEYLDLEVPILGLDDFGEDSEIVGIICDKRTFEIYNNLMTVASAENGRSLYRNFFYHIHQTYLGSPFYNAIFLVKDK